MRTFITILNTKMHKYLAPMKPYAYRLWSICVGLSNNGIYYSIK